MVKQKKYSSNELFLMNLDSLFLSYGSVWQEDLDRCFENWQADKSLDNHKVNAKLFSIVVSNGDVEKFKYMLSKPNSRSYEKTLILGILDVLVSRNDDVFLNVLLEFIGNKRFTNMEIYNVQLKKNIFKKIVCVKNIDIISKAYDVLSIKNYDKKWFFKIIERNDNALDIVNLIFEKMKTSEKQLFLKRMDEYSLDDYLVSWRYEKMANLLGEKISDCKNEKTKMVKI